MDPNRGLDSVGGYQQMKHQSHAIIYTTGDQVNIQLIIKCCDGPTARSVHQHRPVLASNTIKLNEVRNSGLIDPKVVMKELISISTARTASTYFEPLAFKPTPQGHWRAFYISVNGTRSLTSDVHTTDRGQVNCGYGHGPPTLFGIMAKKMIQR